MSAFETRLTAIYSEHLEPGDTWLSWLISQPESLFIFERTEHAPRLLAACANGTDLESEIGYLAGAWGQDLASL